MQGIGTVQLLHIMLYGVAVFPLLPQGFEHQLLVAGQGIALDPVVFVQQGLIGIISPIPAQQLIAFPVDIHGVVVRIRQCEGHAVLVAGRIAAPQTQIFSLNGEVHTNVVGLSSVVVFHHGTAVGFNQLRFLCGRLEAGVALDLGAYEASRRAVKEFLRLVGFLRIGSVHLFQIVLDGVAHIVRLGINGIEVVGCGCYLKGISGLVDIGVI